MKADSQNYEDWINKANNDLLAANGILYYYEDPPTDTICYHCHQTVEKSLKAFIIYSSEEIPWTHDLVELLNLAIALNNQFADLKDDIEILNKYYIEAKYPPDMPILYPKNEAEKAVKIAKKIFEFITKKVIKT